MTEVLIAGMVIAFVTAVVASALIGGKYQAVAEELDDANAKVHLLEATVDRHEDVIKRQQEESAEWQKKWQEANGKANFSQKQLHSLMEDLRGKETKLQYAEEERDHLAKTCQTMEEVTRKQSTAYQKLQSVLAEKDKELSRVNMLLENVMKQHDDEHADMDGFLKDIEGIITDYRTAGIRPFDDPEAPHKVE